MEKEVRERLGEAQRIVVKAGSSTLCGEGGRLDLRVMDLLVRVLADLRGKGKEIALVTSGAVAVGAERLGMAERPKTVVEKQVASAVGQAALIHIYETIFAGYNQKTAQILLTRDALADEVRRENAGNTLDALFKLGIVPVINENDTVSTEELGFSDNDELSAFVAELVGAELLVIFSDVEGLYSEFNGGNRANINDVISFVREFDEKIEELANTQEKSDRGTGGIGTKIAAAKYAAEHGADVVLTNGKKPLGLYYILDGAKIGTVFAAKGRRKNNGL